MKKEKITNEKFAKEIFSRDEKINQLECEIMALKECSHRFIYSFDVVICEKCGLTKRF